MRVYSTSYHFLQLLVSLELKRGREGKREWRIEMEEGRKRKKGVVREKN